MPSVGHRLRKRLLSEDRWLRYITRRSEKDLQHRRVEDIVRRAVPKPRGRAIGLGRYTYTVNDAIGTVVIDEVLAPDEVDAFVNQWNRGIGGTG